MDLRTWALSIVRAETLAAKLAEPPLDLRDAEPGAPLRIDAPGRPHALGIVPAKRAKVPSIEGMPDALQRARILHGSANHELQAVELFAWAILAFPEAPAAFRRGLLQLARDEQRHCQLYIERLTALGRRFGDFPVSGYFWHKTPTLTTPLRFVCAMCLTFESANLDHSLAFAEAAERAGDPDTARVFRQVHADEQRHVRFGWRWLSKLKPAEQTMWDAYRANLTYPLRPALSRGEPVSVEARLAAGIDPDFIAKACAEEPPA